MIEVLLEVYGGSSTIAEGGAEARNVKISKFIRIFKNLQLLLDGTIIHRNPILDNQSFNKKLGRFRITRCGTLTNGPPGIMPADARG